MNDIASLPGTSEAQVREQNHTNGTNGINATNGVLAVEQRVESCKPEYLQLVFVPLFAEAIRQHNGKALVSLIFPLQQVEERRCSMRVVLAQNKVTMIVKELFGEWLVYDEVSQRQYIRLANGRRHHPMPSLKLDGPSKDAMNLVLGQTIVSAVEENPRHKQESSMFTSCVSMEIGAEPADCVLEIGLGLTQGMDINYMLHGMYGWNSNWQVDLDTIL